MTSGEDWGGTVGDAWASQWRATDLSFSALSRHLDAAILETAPETGCAIDIGCGAGATAIALAVARPGVAVRGIDLSPRLVAAARERAAGIPNLTFEVGDASAIPPGPADLLCSRHGVMFFADPVAAFSALRAAIAPRGVFVFSCFRAFELNRWATEAVSAITDAPASPPAPGPGPFAFADPAYVRAILSQSGWVGEERPIDYAYVPGRGRDAVGDAVAFFSRIGPAAARLRELDEPDRDAALARLRALLEGRLENDVVEFPAAAWIWSCRPV